MKTFQFNLKNNFTNIFHLADIHIPNDTDRHNEFIQVFDNLYKTIKSKCNNNSLIIICGDIIDKSGKISPNCINLCKSFLFNLSKLCYLIIIPGNHDDNIRGNDTKIDSLSSIIEGMNYKNLFYFKETGIYKFNNIDFFHLSVFDLNQTIITKKDLDLNKINICLYHGMISSENQNFNNDFLKYQFKYNDFNHFNYVFLGDIHKHFYLNNNKTIAYPGSLLQLNYGEDILSHGGLLHWDLINKNSNFINISNQYGFITMDFKNNNFINNNNFIPKNIKIKINIYNSYIPYNKLLELLQNEFINNNIIDIKPNYINTQNNTTINNFINNDDLEYFLKNKKKLDDKSINNILTIHKEELKNINSNLDSIKNIWNMNFIQFENILGYQKKQTIDFNLIRNKNKLCGIFGKNASGKSSIIYIILFSIFGSMSDINLNDIPNKSNRKMKTLIEFNLGNISYKIERTIRTVKLFKNNINISENTKIETDKIIKHLIGDINIIKNTNISLQEQHNNIINCSNSDKLKIMKKILGLDIYESIFNNIKNFIKDLQNKYDKLNTYLIDKQNILKNKPNIINEIDNLNNKLNDIRYLEINHNNLGIFNLKNKELTSLIYDNKILDNKIKNINLDNSNNFNKELNTINNEINYYNKQFDSNISSNIIKINELNLENEKYLKLMNDINKNNITKDNLPKFQLENINLNKKLNTINETIISLHKNLININDNDINDNINDNKKNNNENKKNNNENIEVVLERYIKELKEFENLYESYKEYQNELSNNINLINNDKDIDTLYKSYIKYQNYINDYDIKFNNNLQSITKLNKKINKHKFHYNPKCQNCLKNKEYNGINELENTIQEFTNDNIILKEKIDKYTKKKKKLGNIEENYNNYNTYKNNLEKNNINLGKIKNKIDFKTNQINKIKIIIKNFKNNQKINSELSLLNINKLECINNINNYNNLIDNFSNLQSKINNNNDLIKKIHNNNIINEKLDNLGKKKIEIEKKIKINLKNTILLNKLQNEFDLNLKKINNLQNDITNLNYNPNLDIFSNKLKEDYLKNLGINENKLIEINNINITNDLIEFKNLEDKLLDYKLYYDIINYKGFPVYLIDKKKLILQNEINKILNTIVDFEINIELKDDKLFFYKNNDIPIKNCSGFEKFIFSISLRIGLINISNFMKPNFIVIDEGFGNMDNINIRKLTDVIDNIKNSFDLILIITHKEELKEKFDNIITVNNFKLFI